MRGVQGREQRGREDLPSDSPGMGPLCLRIAEPGKADLTMSEWPMGHSHYCVGLLISETRKLSKERAREFPMGLRGEI